MQHVLVGDIGGTHARLAYADGGGIRGAIKLRCDEYDSFADLVRDYVATTGSDMPQRAAFAIAAPLSGDEVIWTNRTWRFRVPELREALGMTELVVLNDFEAVAFALPALRPGDLASLGGPAHGLAGAPRLVLGPGTGLGAAVLLDLPTGPVAIPTEGGHATLGLDSPRQRELVAAISPGRVHAEFVLSGGGLSRVHDAVRALEGLPAVSRTPEEITRLAVSGQDAACVTAALEFLRFLGSFAGDAALMTGARGGVFVVGSIARSLAPLFPQAGFYDAFCAKPTMTRYLQAIPVWRVVQPEPGLLGAAVRLGILRHPA